MRRESRIHVLLLNHTAELGGAEHSLLDMVRSVDPELVRWTVVLPAPSRLSDLLAAEGVHIAWLPLRRLTKTLNPVRLLGMVRSLAHVGRQLTALIEKERVDLVHSNSTTAHLYAARPALRSGRPAIWHCRDWVRLGALGHWLSRRAARMIAPSEAVARNLRRYGNPAALRVIPNGIDVSRFIPGNRREALRAEWAFPPDAFVVAMAGQLVPWKNQADFLRAAALAAPRVPQARYLLIGGDLFGDQAAYQAHLHRLAERLRLEPLLRFTGHRTDFPEMLQGIDMLVHPAAREPFGRTVAEAMATEKVVVAANAGGPAEIIEDERSGLLVAPGDPARMADAVVRCHANPDWALAVGKEARRRIVAHFSSERLGRDLATLYTELVGGPRP